MRKRILFFLLTATAFSCLPILPSLEKPKEAPQKRYCTAALLSSGIRMQELQNKKALTDKEKMYLSALEESYDNLFILCSRWIVKKE